MLLNLIRGIFILIVAAIALLLADNIEAIQKKADLMLMGCVGLAAVCIAVDMLLPTKSLTALSGLFFGLVMGLLISWAMGFVVDLVISALDNRSFRIPPGVAYATKLLLGAISCYLCVSFIIQTKDDFRFVVPYVEFAKQTKGLRPLILDTSVIIDGRIADISETKFINAPMILPRFVLEELQTIADSSDKLKRNRGRRGLDVLHKLQENEKIELAIQDSRLPTEDQSEAVDLKLISLAKHEGGLLMTHDYNLNKIAQLRGVDVVNINDLANALKPVVLPGECMKVRIIKPGEEQGQGVGYLEDGTMVVGEGCRDSVNQEVTLTVTSALQTSAGRMIFGRLEDPQPASSRSTRHRARVNE